MMAKRRNWPAGTDRPSSLKPAVEVPAEPPLGPPASAAAPEVSPVAARGLNRDISWLEFNSRVLHEAEDPRTPLLERVNFLAIVTSNLDEFIMKRLGLLRRHLAAGSVPRSSGTLSPRQLALAIRQRVQALVARQAAAYADQLRPALAQHDIQICSFDDLTPDEAAWAQHHFRTTVFPVLTPLAVDPGHPFPFISNLSTSLGVTLRHPDQTETLFARVKIPEVLPQFVRLNGQPPGSAGLAGNKHRFISLLELIRRHLDDLFPGMIVTSVMPFRITRNAGVDQDTEDVEDLRDLVELELRLRKFEPVVRLEVPLQPDPWMLEFLLQELELTAADVYEMPALLDYTALRVIAELPVRELRYEPWSPLVPRRLADPTVDIFSVIRQGDLLIHHPYESFSASIERFVRSAADDPHVLAIKITLYRTGEDSPFIPTLIRAAESGKQVVVLVELKARFDEERNIELTRALEKAGVHVVYGLVGLKTHTKVTLVVRQEPDGLKCYSHIGTGNYHMQTARLYTDVSLLSCRADLAEDLVDLFHFLTGRSLKRQYGRLLVAPVNMLERFLALIDREIVNQKAGRPARIVAKMNSLEADEIIDALYRAGQAGVPVDLVVRGFCCLRPGVPGMSENIRVISVLGRFLEHSRIYHFAAGQADPRHGEFYAGSADWMYRNLLGRVEVVTPVDEPSAKERLWEILQVLCHDQRQAWEMQPDGSYVQRQPQAEPGPGGLPPLGTHAALMLAARKAAAPAGEMPGQE